MAILHETNFENIALPPIIYKYRVWENPEHKRMLTEGEIFFASPSDFNEQHECNLERDFDSLTDDMIFKFCYLTAPKNSYSSDSDRREIATRMITDSRIRNKEHQEEIQENFRNKINTDLSIFSASKHKDIFSLWQTFANDQTGFCIGLNTRKMFANNEIFGSGGCVEYYPIKNQPKIRPITFSKEEKIEDMMKVIYSLPDKFSREDEYRLAKSSMENKRISLNPLAFEEVILGCEMTKESKEEIKAIAIKRFPQIKIYQANYNYDLEIYAFQEIK